MPFLLRFLNVPIVKKIVVEETDLVSKQDTNCETVIAASAKIQILQFFDNFGLSNQQGMAADNCCAERVPDHDEQHEYEQERGQSHEQYHD